MNQIVESTPAPDRIAKVTTIRGNQWFRMISDHRWLILLPAIACLGLSAAYAMLAPKLWRASQVFHLRDEMIGRQDRPGHFSSLDDMKTAQETILEIARNPNVVRRCLQTTNGSQRPTDRDVEMTQAAIQISSSNGAELGKTELIRLSCVDRTPESARAFCQQLAGEMETELRNVRFNRACSMVAELSKATEAAQASLDDVAKQIEEFEHTLGPDLGDLRNLIEKMSGDNLLYRNLNQIQTELRAAEVNLESVALQRTLLRASFDDVNSVVATPNELLNLQPALRRLKDGLVDSQLKLASLRGDYHDNHPKVLNALEAVASIKLTLREELGLASRGLEDQIQVLEANVAQLKKLASQANARLQRLTEQRVVYDQLNEEYKRRDAGLRNAQTKVAQAESIQVAANSVDLLTRVDDVQVASRPEGLSKRTLVGATTLLGFFIGLGLVMLLYGPDPSSAPPSLPAAASIAVAPVGSTTYSTATWSAAESTKQRELVDQILDRGSFAVTVMPSNVMLSKPGVD